LRAFFDGCIRDKQKAEIPKGIAERSEEGRSGYVLHLRNLNLPEQKERLYE